MYMHCPAGWSVLQRLAHDAATAQDEDRRQLLQGLMQEVVAAVQAVAAGLADEGKQEVAGAFEQLCLHNSAPDGRHWMGLGVMQQLGLCA